MKALIRRVARSAGYEIRKIQPCLSVDGDFEPANRNYRPAVLQYRRNKFGDDQRLKYIVNFLDLRELRTLEPGPFGGHHSIVLEKMGVRENIAIESRTDNLQLCLRIKEKYGLDRTTFLLGNLEDFYNGTKQPPFTGRFDLVFCLGVLYHVPEVRLWHGFGRKRRRCFSVPIIHYKIMGPQWSIPTTETPTG